MKALIVAGAVFLVVCATGTRVEAQSVAASFDQLAVLVKAGDKITVLDVAGRETDGRIGILSRDAMTLLTDAGPRVLDQADVLQIRQRRGDSLTNGAIIGAAAGLGYGLALLAISYSISDGGGPIPITVITGMAMCTGLGAAAGAGIDALITRRQVIYQKVGGRSRVSVSPLFGRGLRGAAVIVKF